MQLLNLQEAFFVLLIFLSKLAALLFEPSPVFLTLQFIEFALICLSLCFFLLHSDLGDGTEYRIQIKEKYCIMWDKKCVFGEPEDFHPEVA